MASRGRDSRWLQGMEFRFHPGEGAEIPEADVLEDGPHFGDVVCQVFGFVGVRADGQQGAAQLVVPGENPPGGREVRKLVFEAGGVDLDALTVCDGPLQDGVDPVHDLVVGVIPLLVVALDHVQVAQHGIILVPVHDVVDGIVVAGLVFILGLAPLVVVGPEFLVVHLVVAQDDEIEGPGVKISLELRDGAGLDAELDAGFDDEPVRVGLPGQGQLFKIGRVVAV